MPISWEDLCDLLEDMVPGSNRPSQRPLFYGTTFEVGNAALHCRLAVKANPATGEYKQTNLLFLHQVHDCQRL